MTCPELHEIIVGTQLFADMPVLTLNNPFDTVRNDSHKRQQPVR